jgi:predicted nucleic acid-binding protein
MEVLAGARDEALLRAPRGLLARASLEPTVPADYEAAAALYRTCRHSGEAVRRLIDCLIAAHAIRAGLVLLHADPVYEVLARHTALEIERPEL